MKTRTGRERNSIPSEALLPGTDALLRGTVEISPSRKGGWLVPYRLLNGMAYRWIYKEPAWANEKFWKCADHLKKKAKTR